MFRSFGSRRRMALIGAAGIAVGALAGPPTVSVADDAWKNVFVVNGPEQAVPVSVQKPEFFQHRDFISLAPGDTVGTGGVDIPDGKDLVVEYVTVKAKHVDSFWLNESEGSSGAGVFVPLIGEGAHQAGSEMTQVRMSGLGVNVGRAENVEGGRVDYVVSGYLVDSTS